MIGEILQRLGSRQAKLDRQNPDNTVYAIELTKVEIATLSGLAQECAGLSFKAARSNEQNDNNMMTRHLAYWGAAYRQAGTALTNLAEKLQKPKITSRAVEVDLLGAMHGFLTTHKLVLEGANIGARCENTGYTADCVHCKREHDIQSLETILAKLEGILNNV